MPIMPKIPKTGRLKSESAKIRTEANSHFSKKLGCFGNNHIKWLRLVQIAALFYNHKTDTSQLSEILTSLNFGQSLY